MLQVAERAWPAGAVHDTVAAVVRSAAFRRTLQNSFVERLLQWLFDWLERMSRLFQGMVSARAIALGVAGALVVLVVGRVILAARARDADAVAGSRRGRGAPGEDPWRDADRLAAQGRFDEAAHALYRGVLAGLARTEPVRLHPSKTSGDYRRELRARGSPSFAPFRAFVRRFDLAVYGHGGCDAAAVAELRRLADPFAPTARAA